MDALIATESITDVAWLPDNAVDWIEREFYSTETKDVIELVDYQAATITEALRRDADGLFVYDTVVWSDTKKSAKSSITGAVMLWSAWHNDLESCRVVGNDLKQASSRTFAYIEETIRLNPRLSQVCKIKTNHITLPNRTVIQAIPVDPRGEAGGGDLMICFTEMWAYKNKSHQTMWSEMTLSPLKYGRSQTWVESYAGFEGESPVLESLYAKIKDAEIVDVGIPGLELYRHGRMLILWNTIPRCPWLTEQYYQSEANRLTDSEFRRMHRNEWQSSTESFVPIEWWDSTRVDQIPALRQWQNVVIGMDAAVTGDCFALVAVSRTADMLETRAVRLFTPPKGGSIQFSNPDNPDDENTPEGVIRAWARMWSIAEVAYDPYQLHDFATRLRSQLSVHFRPFPQMSDRLIADKQLYDLIRERRILHTGEPDLRAHIMNSNQEAGKQDTKLRIVKRPNTDLKIDACVALSMAAARALHLNIG